MCSALFRHHLLHEHAQSLSLRNGIETYSTIPSSDARRRVLLDSVRQGGRAAFRQRLCEKLASTPTLSLTAEHLGAAPSAADFVFVSTPDVRSGADHSAPTVHHKDPCHRHHLHLLSHLGAPSSLDC